MSFYRSIGQAYSEISGHETYNESYYSDWDRDWLQYQMGEYAADNSDARTRQLYNDIYSPQAQMDQLKAAGLSPSIFASGGIAGKSGVSGAMGSRGSSNSGGSQMMSNMFSAIAQATQIAANVSKTKAETDLIKAQTANLDQDTQNKGVQKDLITAQIAETLQNTKYKEVATAALNTQNAIDQYTLKLQEWKWNEGITQEMVESEARKMYNESMISGEQWSLIQNEVKYSNATLETNIKIVCEQYLNLMQDTLKKTCEVDLTIAQTRQVTEDILVKWYNAEVYKLSEKNQILWCIEQLRIAYKQLDLQKYGIDINGIIQQMQINGSTINSCIGAIANITGMGILSGIGKGLLNKTTNNTTTPPVGTPNPQNMYY